MMRMLDTISCQEKARKKERKWVGKKNAQSERDIVVCYVSSVTRLGDLFDLWPLFKAFGNSLFAQISEILRQFL